MMQTLRVQISRLHRRKPPALLHVPQLPWLAGISFAIFPSFSVQKPLAESASFFLVLCGVKEGNSGNWDPWFGEKFTVVLAGCSCSRGCPCPVFLATANSRHLFWRGAGIYCSSW